MDVSALRLELEKIRDPGKGLEKWFFNPGLNAPHITLDEYYETFVTLLKQITVIEGKGWAFSNTSGSELTVIERRSEIMAFKFSAAPTPSIQFNESRSGEVFNRICIGNYCNRLEISTHIYSAAYIHTKEFLVIRFHDKETGLIGKIYHPPWIESDLVWMARVFAAVKEAVFEQ